MASVALPRSIADAITAQARAEAPNEACGLVIGSAPAVAGGVALRYEACRNADASPVRYTIHSDDLIRLAIATDDADEVFWGIVHSHVASPAVPSPTDVGLASYPEALYLLVSLAGASLAGASLAGATLARASLAGDQGDHVAGGPSLRAWQIVEGAVHEVALEIT